MLVQYSAGEICKKKKKKKLDYYLEMLVRLTVEGATSHIFLGHKEMEGSGWAGTFSSR